MNKLDIKGVIFDFGGTLDTRGDHWSEVLWKGYRHFHVPVEKEDFRSAYVYGERTLATNPIIQPNFHFIDVLREKNKLQLSYLVEHQKLKLNDMEVVDLAIRMTQYEKGLTNEVLEESRSVLEYLKDKYPMVLVSNFYGNIETVLQDAHIDGYFKRIIESAVVGVRKPNPAIFALGVCALDLPASQVVVVGDTFNKDIAPAHALGCHTIWIKGLQWEEKQYDETLPDGIISRISELKNYL